MNADQDTREPATLMRSNIRGKILTRMCEKTQVDDNAAHRGGRDSDSNDEDEYRSANVSKPGLDVESSSLDLGPSGVGLLNIWLRAHRKSSRVKNSDAAMKVFIESFPPPLRKFALAMANDGHWKRRWNAARPAAASGYKRSLDEKSAIDEIINFMHVSLSTTSPSGVP
jgi:hypothetical protein